MQERGDHRPRCSSTIASSATSRASSTPRPPRWRNTGSPTCRTKSSTAACNCSAAMAIWTNIRSRACIATPACSDLCRHQRDHEAADRAGAFRLTREMRQENQHGRSLHLRSRPHAARPRQARRLAARGDRAQSRGAGARRDQDRNELDPSLVDDVVLGCVDPVGEAGGNIARSAALLADYGDTVPGLQINRFCASGLDAVNFAAAQVMAGQQDMAIGGGVESMSRVGIGAAGGAWPTDPSIAIKSYFMPQGISADLIATQLRLLARRRRRLCGREPEARRAAWEDGRFRALGHRRSRTSERPHHPGQGRAHAPEHDHAVARRAPARRSCRWASSAGSTRSRSRRIPKSKRSTTCTMPAIPPASSMAPPPC